MLKIDIICCLNDNYSYVITDDISHTIGGIDPSEYEPINNFIKIKNYKKLDYILNTHHHHDHVGGNLKLKEKYNAKIAGSLIDKDRIPGVDILLKEGEIFKFGKTSFEVIFIPGHTKGHIGFYSAKDKVFFSGDTLFSLGCGRIFEGTYSQMFNSLNKIKKLPIDTKIFCGHEYTKTNSDFCIKYENNNKLLQKKIISIKAKVENNLPTIPVSLKDELETNVFLRCENTSLKNTLQMKDASDEDIFKKLRDLKDNF